MRFSRFPSLRFAVFVTLSLAAGTLFAQNDANASAAATALTIYNQQFAVVRNVLPLDLKNGVTHVDVTDITTHLEPDSVILRPLDDRLYLQILEQNYRNDPISAPLLLSLFEGKTIDFDAGTLQDGTRHIVRGKIVRSGYTPHYNAYQLYGQQYAYQQQAYSQTDQPIVEVDGKLQFSLPGQPIFPSLADDTILKPTLSWELETDKPGPSRAEFSYVTGGMMWQADYNLVAPVKGNTLDMVGWVTLDNQSGKTFPNARIKLMAGDVNKLQPGGPMVDVGSANGFVLRKDAAAPPVVTERSFDEYHLYTLQRPTTLRDRETKQVEFVHAENIQAQSVYVYDGAQIDWQRYSGWQWENFRNDQSFGTQWNPKIWVMKEFKNSKANNLGIALPKGRVRFYRRDDDGQLEFTGENTIDHTPENETLRIYTGNAFDVVGERHRTDYRMDSRNNMLDETFEIQLRNHKKEPVQVRVVEHLYRWNNWEIRQNSDEFKKKDSQTIEYTVMVPADGSKTVKYTAHYSW
jgi:hypothetical protein